MTPKAGIQAGFTIFFCFKFLVYRLLKRLRTTAKEDILGVVVMALLLGGQILFKYKFESRLRTPWFNTEENINFHQCPLNSIFFFSIQ